MTQNIVHQEKDSLVQDIPWKGIPVGYEVAPTILTAGESTRPLPQSGTGVRHAKNLLRSQLPSLVRWEGPSRVGGSSSRLQIILHPSKEN